MSKAIKFTINLANEAEISEHLSCCDDNFVPPLSSRVEIVSYAKKIETLAMRFEARAGSKLIGLDEPGHRTVFDSTVRRIREGNRYAANRT